MKRTFDWSSSFTRHRFRAFDYLESLSSRCFCSVLIKLILFTEGGCYVGYLYQKWHFETQSRSGELRGETVYSEIGFHLVILITLDFGMSWETFPHPWRQSPPPTPLLSKLASHHLPTNPPASVIDDESSLWINLSIYRWRHVVYSVPLYLCSNRFPVQKPLPLINCWHYVQMVKIKINMALEL